ncbi:DoxX family protein [Streptomyces sp. V3I7]|uniref:DoxX family protein n=1 Tax=Streptomyces sp. V3I7 TaxID=3042278 RepID=UPI0027890DD0|nr:DoxX family membrane protein [Streptomyces sp. V3I7]MDQ0994585.1 putative oxidoreductase [Streptomyces sp. V3I7]
MAHLSRKDLGLLAMRLGTSGVLFVHGTQKLFGWFGGHGIDATANAMESMGFHPGKPAAIAAGAGEAGGGLLLALGVATPVAGAAAAGAMAGAVAVHRKAGFFATAGGYEYPAYLGFMAAGLGLAGPGRISLDHATHHRLNRPPMVLLALAGAAVAAFAIVDRREKALSAQALKAEAQEIFEDQQP